MSKILNKVPKLAPKKHGLDETELKNYTEYVWELVESVRKGRYKVKDVNSVVEQVEDERRNSYFG